MTSQEAPRGASGLLLLADISGYTSFMQSVALAHQDDAFADGAVPDAYAMMSNLLDGIVGRVVPPFTLSELEGDAVFAYATDPDPVPSGEAMLDCLTECYADFRRRVGTGRGIWTCSCDACSRIDVLDLKFILHAGAYVTQEIAGKSKLLGPEVVMAHRLLKNNAATWWVTARTHLSRRPRPLGSAFRPRPPSRLSRPTSTTRQSAPTSFRCGRPRRGPQGHPRTTLPTPRQETPKVSDGRSAEQLGGPAARRRSRRLGLSRHCWSRSK